MEMGVKLVNVAIEDQGNGIARGVHRLLLGERLTEEDILISFAIPS